jgi:uncharacterized protein
MGAPGHSRRWQRLSSRATRQPMSENAPRYLPGRALPATAFLPGRSARPTAALAGRNSAGDLTASTWRTHADYLWGVDLYNAGFAWEAHEAWEEIWRGTPQPSSERLFLQGLIQCAAASVKSALGQTDAVQRIAKRALDRLERVRAREPRIYLGVELESFIAEFRHFVLTQPDTFAARPRLRLHMAAD